MGIKDLTKVITTNAPDAISNLKNSDLINKKVGIDTSIILYQFITALGGNLKTKAGKSTAHIHGILIKTLNYLKAGIIPVHIFDGKPPELKLKRLEDRTRVKDAALKKISELDIESDSKVKEKLIKQTLGFSYNEMLEAKEIVELLGVPNIIAPEEADAQLAYLSRNDLVDYVASEDMDLLTFGTKKLIKNFMKSSAKDKMVLVSLDDILETSDITMDQFIDLCILLGCDYTDTIDGVGPKKAWELIKKYKSLENIIISEKKIINNTYKLPDNFRYVEVRDYFVNLRHTKVDKLELKVPQFDKLKKILIEKYEYSEDLIEEKFKFLRKKHNIYDSNYKKNVDDIFID
jgi:flap endonuclease-1